MHPELTRHDDTRGFGLDLMFVWLESGIPPVFSFEGLLDKIERNEWSGLWW